MARSAAEVAARLGRAVRAVERRRSHLVTISALPARVRPCPRAPRRTWTTDEDAIVRATRERPVHAIAIMIPGHTPEAIRCRRRTLRLRDDATH